MHRCIKKKGCRKEEKKKPLLLVEGNCIKCPIDNMFRFKPAGNDDISTVQDIDPLLLLLLIIVMHGPSLRIVKLL